MVFTPSFLTQSSFALIAFVDNNQNLWPIPTFNISYNNPADVFTTVDQLIYTDQYSIKHFSDYI